MNKPFKVSQSKLKTWKTCKYKYHLKYNERLNPEVKGRPLVYGSIIHEMIEAHTEGHNPFKKLRQIKKKQGKLFERERELYGNIIETAEVVFEAYLEFYEDEPLHFIKIQGRRSEHEFELEIAPGIVFIWKVDGFVRSPAGLRYLLENKTGANIPDEDDRWRDLQVHMYIKTSEMLGIKKFDGVCWNYVKSSEPTVPEYLPKSNRLSTRKINTLPAIVHMQLEEHELETKGHEVLIERAEEAVSKFFERKFEPVNRRVMEETFESFLIVANEMRELTPTRKEKNIDRHCKWCDFRSICRAELTGGDVEGIKEREFSIGRRDETAAEKAAREKERKTRSKKVARRKRSNKS